MHTHPYIVFIIPHYLLFVKNLSFSLNIKPFLIDINQSVCYA